VPNVYALNADTGQVVWQVHLDAPDAALGGAVVGALTVSGNTVYALVNQRGDGTLGPYVVALDRLSGAVRWRSAPIVTAVGNYTNATPTVADGVVIAGFSAAEGNPFGHGGFALVEASTGRVLARTYTVPPDQWGTPAKPLYAGGGVWTTPAVDAADRYAYMGTGNPFSKQIQYPRTDALLKVDIDRSRPTFGQIVAFYPGNIDQSSPVVKQLAGLTCALLPDDPLRALPLPDPRLLEIRDVVSNSIGCLQLDLDFGAAPNLFRSPAGRLVVGDLQKSGVYHAVYADTMKRAWTSTLGISCTVCNADSTAYAGGSIYVDSTPGTLMDSISSSTGRLHWLGIVADVVHYESVSVADGVVYSPDGFGFLDAFRADNGLPLLRRSMVLDAGTDALPPSGYSSAGVAVARHTVYVEAGSHVIAYRPKALLGH
jgi:outer membrane protein assembly factor BamB